MIRRLALALALCIPTPTWAGPVATFENFGLGANSFLNNAGGPFFNSFGLDFNNSFDNVFSVWSGWAISNMTDTVTPGFTNQYSAITGSGSGSPTYAIGGPFSFFTDPKHPADSFVNLPAGQNPLAVDVTNTTYAYYSMLNGDSFAKKFGPGDFFTLDIQAYDGLNGAGNLLGSVDFDLADFKNGNSNIVNTWKTIDLSSLAGAQSLRFGMTSSDNSIFGINTPAFFAADNLQTGTSITANPNVVPEPSSLIVMGSLLGFAGFVTRRRKAKPME